MIKKIVWLCLLVWCATMIVQVSAQDDQIPAPLTIDPDQMMKDMDKRYPLPSAIDDPTAPSGEIQSNTAQLDPSALQKASVELEELESKSWHKMPSELKDKLRGGSLGSMFNSATLAEFQAILANDKVAPEERIFEAELLLRSRSGDWTMQSTVVPVLEKGAIKGADILRDYAIKAALNKVLGGVPFIVEAIMTFDTYGYSFIPGLLPGSKGYAQDAVKLHQHMMKQWETANFTKIYEQVLSVMRQTRGANEDAIKDYVVRLEEDNSMRDTNVKITIENEYRSSLRSVYQSFGFNEAQIQTALRYLSGVPDPTDENIETMISKQLLDPIGDPNRERLLQFQIACNKVHLEARKKFNDELLQIARNNLVIEAMEIRLLAGRQPENSIVILIDASNSMNDGGKVSSAKSTARSQIARLGPETELAIRAFSGNGASFDFSPMTPTARARAQGVVESINANGGTPLAANIRAAGAYMRNHARGKNMTLIILSDGEETEGGDPPAEVSRLNDVSVSW